MGNIILTNDFVDSDSVILTHRTEATGYNSSNVFDYWNLKRRFRANDIKTDDYILKFDFLNDTALQAIFLNDVNFSKVKIQGNSTDSWGTPSYSTTELTVSQNKITGRYQIYIPLENFDYRYMRIFIPNSAGAVGPYGSKWEIGAVCMIKTATELTYNMNYGYKQCGKQFYNDALSHRVKVWEIIRWESELVFGDRDVSGVSDIQYISKIDLSEPLIFYENRGDSSAAYLCAQDNSMEITEFTYNGFSGSTITLKEIFMIGQKV